jgi:murein DD-endopeptidase MepM/ murein hydrolase activator NlpD
MSATTSWGATDVPARRPLLAVVAGLVLLGLPSAAQPPVGGAAGPVYYLPAPAGTKLLVTQGQNNDDHSAANYSLYALDFGIRGNAEFDVTAARGGTVISLRDNSQAHCYVTATDEYDVSCWKDANYALVDHGDGTSALYVHLAYLSGAVKVGDHVTAGRKLAQDDNTGFSSANHLHFMVESTPTVPNTPPPGPTDKTSVAWWWTNSLLVAFSDPDVVAQSLDGIPRHDQTYTSGAPEATGAPTPTPTPTPTPAPVLGGTWKNPADGAKVTSVTLTLAAKPTATLTDVRITKVVFTVAWGSNGPKTACTAKRAGSNGIWTCKVNLSTLGAPLGKLTLSFDVFDDAGDLIRSPAGTRVITYQPPPAAPTNLSMTNTVVDPCPAKTWDGTVGPYGCNLFTLSWTAPTGALHYHLFACVNGFEYETLCQAGGKPFATLSGTTTSLKLAAVVLENPSFAISAIGPGGESRIVQFSTQ